MIRHVYLKRRLLDDEAVYMVTSNSLWTVMFMNFNGFICLHILFPDWITTCMPCKRNVKGMEKKKDGGKCCTLIIKDPWESG